MNPRLTSPAFHKLLELLVVRSSGRAIMEDYVEWALSELESGLDTPNLRILAGLAQPLYSVDVERYFKRTLADLKIELPSDDLFLRQYVCQLARDIVSGAMSPTEGCRKIVGLWFHLDHTPELRNWDVLEDDLYVYGGKGGDGMNSAIVKEAKALLARSFCGDGV